MRLPKLAGLSIFLLFMASLTIGCVRSTVPPDETTTVPATPTQTTIQAPILTSAPAANSTSSVNSVFTNQDNWPTYHRDLSRSGFAPETSISGSIHRLWTSDVLDGDIYAEPLVIGEKVLIATEHNSIYSLNIANGKILWHVNLGAPVPRSELSCGNIDPSGITGTPVADPVTERLYVVARLQPNHHALFILDIKTGAIISLRSIDPPGSDPRVQQQRAALVLSGGKVYIAFGGLFGDCGSYYGWLVDVPADGNGQLNYYRVSSHRGASLWAPSGPAVDSAGDLYVTSGNGFSRSTFDYSNSVLRISPGLSLEDWFAPDNWQELDNGDVDLGSMGPALLQGGLVFQAGKGGTGYLLKSDNLGHIGGEIFSDSIGERAYGGTAYAPPYIFVPGTNGLVALLVDTGPSPSFRVLWSGPDFFAGPPVVAGGTVLTVNIGSGTLYGFTADKGEVLFKIHLGPVVHFTTPTLSQGSIFVAADRRILNFGP